MEYDITGNIANLVINADPQLVQKIEEHKRTLRRLGCKNPFFGGWVEMGVEYLFSVFDLEDRYFAARLPALAHLNKPARRQFIKNMESHLHDCEHCALKHQHELDLNARIEEACRGNRDTLLDQLGAEIPDSLEPIAKRSSHS